jgi:hypothetical protein
MRLRSFKRWVYGVALLTAWWFLAAGCPHPSKGEKMLTQDQAIEIAKNEFARHGRLVSDYAVTIETYHADDKQWIVWFDKIGPFPIPGGKHAVLVDKMTGHAVFMPGE